MKKVNFLIFIVIILIANLLVRGPDVWHALNTPTDKWFSGQASWFDPWDLNVYFSVIGQGQRGAILFDNQYDSISGKPMFIYQVYTGLGKLFSPFGWSNQFIFHFSAFLLSFFLGAIIWRFLKIFIASRRSRVLAFAIIFLGGGLGWLFYLKLMLPDISYPVFILESVLRRPHEAVSSGLLLLAMGFLWKSNFIKAGLASFVTIFLHPYNVLLLAASVSWEESSEAARPSAIHSRNKVLL